MTRALLCTACLLALAPAAFAQKPMGVAKTNAAAIRGEADASLVGALHEFAYERGALYAITTAPQRVTDIALEPGEALQSVSAGDTTRWIVGDGHSGGSAAGQAHVLVKPNAAALATNLIIMTDRRVYHIELKSVAGPSMAAVSWRYPTDMMISSAPPAPPPPPPPPVFAPEKLDLHYKVEGDKPDWRPLAAFNDGQQVFIEMPERIKTMEAPPLFVIGDEGAELVNYRIQGTYYVVDRLFTKAEFRLGAGWNKKTVRIVHQIPVASTPAPVKGGPRG